MLRALHAEVVGERGIVVDWSRVVTTHSGALRDEPPSLAVDLVEKVSRAE